MLRESSIELSIINLQVIISSKFLELVGFDVIYNKNILFIEGGQPVAILTGCNFFKHIHTFLFFFISFPSSKKRMYKYILICLTYLSFTQIFRIISFTICLKYFPIYWDVFHKTSSYLFYCPGTLTLWYFYSLKPNVSKQKT